MKYYIVIDGGGTSTYGAVADENGNIVKDATFGASNPHDIGTAQTKKLLSEIVGSLMRDGVAAVCAGIAGSSVLKDELTGSLAAAFPHVPVKVVPDAEIMFRAGIPDGDGAAVISGTGSVCYVRKDGEYHRIGGWGWLLDNGGSGYDIGRDGISAVLAAHDGRGDATEISGRLIKKLGGTPWDKLKEIYDGGRPFIASFAECVFAADETGDMVAGEILDRNARALASYISTAYAILDKPFVTVLGGGVHEKQPGYVKRIVNIIKEDGIPTDVSLVGRDPVFGALEIAKEL